MKQYMTFAFLMVFLMFPASLSAQIELKMLNGKTLAQIEASLGKPISTEVDEYDGAFIRMKYADMEICFYEKNKVVGAAYIMNAKICVLSDYISGGVKIGDNISKVKDVDFTKLAIKPGTFPGYRESDGFTSMDNLTPYESPCKCYEGKFIPNCKIFDGRNVQYLFAVENDVIKAIQFWTL